MALMTSAGLFVMLVGQLNTPFFGLTFHFPLVATAFLAFTRGILQQSQHTGFSIAAAVLVAVALWNASVFRRCVDYSKVVDGTRVFCTESIKRFVSTRASLEMQMSSLSLTARSVREP